MNRLAEYKVTEKKAEAAKSTGGDTAAILRQSNVKVIFEHDGEAHLDRTVALVNRTNQRNFTKNRLPDVANLEQSKRLAHNTTAEVVMSLATERGPLHFADPNKLSHPYHQRLNTALKNVAKGRGNVMLRDPAALIDGTEDMIDLNHFKPDVYHRMYRATQDRFTSAKAA
ncbi:hypothetical protein A8B82_20985 [Sulfitobacter sp. EhC04]|uniref:hypothetical protein n=1 Tax=Sulfitobacter sp. EhC04 TaxID=1849168 RepID=UPI0007F46385|nr:hypothetical protein [Sulfitobacter sp. EhC04]OAN71760.1 hypothetical protein A8B82_20985 [Sulfitobacter sp. EhC04]